jgi:hypothetical protein
MATAIRTQRLASNRTSNPSKNRNLQRAARREKRRRKQLDKLARRLDNDRERCDAYLQELGL